MAVALSDLGSLAALLAAGAAMWQAQVAKRAARNSERTAEAALRLQEEAMERERRKEREAEKAARRARFSAEIGHIPGWKSESLIVTNQGPADARNVEVTVDGSPPEEHAVIVRAHGDPTHLPPGGRLVYNLAISAQSADTITVEVGWADDAGRSGPQRFVLPI